MNSSALRHVRHGARLVGSTAFRAIPCSGPSLSNMYRWMSISSTSDGDNSSETLEDVARKANAKVDSSKQIGGPGIGPKDADMAAMFTCGVCDTRVLKSFTRHSYEKGVVIVECPGCHNLHVLADNLGWFGEEKNIEEILKAKGEKVAYGKLVDGNIEIV